MSMLIKTARRSELKACFVFGSTAVNAKWNCHVDEYWLELPEFNLALQIDKDCDVVQCKKLSLSLFRAILTSL